MTPDQFCPKALPTPAGLANRGTIPLIPLCRQPGPPLSKSQMDSKVKRLGEIFGNDQFTNPDIKPILVLTSPKPPTEKLGAMKWSEWMTKDGSPRWMQMTMPKRRQLIRCDKNGKSDAKGQHAKIIERN
ncbi:MAG: hypothetical protein O3C20_23820 [Verrucomicrobia bacterium]|nr:hypothetical protein [Verrucomicrobiota bacterium]